MLCKCSEVEQGKKLAELSQAKFITPLNREEVLQSLQATWILTPSLPAPRNTHPIPSSIRVALRDETVKRLVKGPK